MQMLLNFFKKIVEESEKQSKRRKAIRELQALNDRQLRDMGIARCDIYRVVSGENYA